MPTKAQMTRRKKAAKKATKKHAKSAIVHDTAVSHMDYRLVGVIEPECFRLPVSTATSRQHTLPPITTSISPGTLHTPQSTVPHSTSTSAAIADSGIVERCSSDQLPTIYFTPNTKDNKALDESTMRLSATNMSAKFDEVSGFKTDKSLNSAIVGLSSCANNDSVLDPNGVAAESLHKTTEGNSLVAKLTRFRSSNKAFSFVPTWEVPQPEGSRLSTSSAQDDCTTHAVDIVEKEPQSSIALIPTVFGPVRLFVAIATPPIAQIPNTRKLQMLVLGQPMDPISTRLSAWIRCEFFKRYLIETQPPDFKSQLRTRSRASPEPPAEYGALVPYLHHHSPEPIPETEKIISNSFASNSSLDSFMASRIFLIGDENSITCINYGQPLYNVDAIQDDGGSDFDSIASPTKMDLSQVFNDTTGSGSSPYRNSTLSTETYTNEEDHYKFGIKDFDGWVSEDESTTGLDDASSVDTVIRYKVNLHPPNEAPTGKEKTDDVTKIPIPTTSNEDTPESSYNVTLQGEMSSIASSQTVACNTMDEADWTCERARMRLGTESFFTFLEVLELKNNGNTTMGSVVAAFLEMVDLEREKRGTVLLPSACTAHRLLSSQILPHVVMLGKTTVYAVMKELAFDGNDEIKIVDIYGAWDRLSREEMRLQNMASKGIMGALGRSLGKFSPP
ncbi:hypothetical protein PTMSG1_04436 [Pyrenophora teres f. maculata]|nr:hypothetical protein PTMSG1_04436 [Pyrenophora teres f. maculata]